MIIRICDRCRKEIVGNYWTIDIYEHEDNTGRATTEGAINNTQRSIDKIFKREKEYCKNCIKAIKISLKKHEQRNL
jgi:hypothetical protein